MTDIEKMKQAALNAAQGEWMRLFGERTVYDRLEDGCRGNAIVRADTCFTEQDTKNLNHIATANPAAVLELIHRLEDAESQLASQELVIHQLRDALDWIQTHCAGDAMPKWEKTPHTGQSRGLILDRTNYALAIPTSTEHLEAWYKEMVGEPVGHFYETAEYSYTQCWPSDTGAIPFHTIKPFPFKDE